MKCKICEAEANAYAATTVRRKYSTTIWQCRSCGFVFFAPVNWLDEAYQEAINKTDIGYVERNLAAASFLSSHLETTRSKQSLYCDFGAGYGLLVRLMRDRGFRFHWHDPYCKNLFARYCEASLEQFAPYVAVSAIEVFEHAVDPHALLRELRTFSNHIVFTTRLLPSAQPPDSWWYFGLDHGQHVSFYSPEALRRLGALYGLHYQHLGGSWHRYSSNLSDLAVGYGLGRVLKKAGRFLRSMAGDSLREQDYQAALQLQQREEETKQARPNIDGFLGLGH